MIDPDDLPGYLHDAYGAALDHGLQSLNLTRIGGDAKMWQASSRFARSSGYHVSIEADLFEALLGALGAWVRVDRAPAAPEPAPAGPHRPWPKDAEGHDVDPADMTPDERVIYGAPEPTESEDGGLFD